MMKRRELIALAGAAAATWSTLSFISMLRAQPGTRARRIGVLMGTAATEQGQSYFAAFVQRLVELGWSKDRNTNIDVRWWTGEPEQMRPAIAELLALSPDVVMVFSNLALAVLKPMAGNVPIVFVGVGDPVGDGFVASLARPDGNITGFAGNHGPMGGKWLEVLKETAPHLTRIQAIYHPETPVHQAFWHSIREAAPRLGVEVTAGGVHDAAEIERTVSSFATKPNGGMVVLPHAVTWANENLLIALGLQFRLPAVFATASSVTAGGLVSYGQDFEYNFRQTAEYVDRILRGERPGDLPVQQPTKYKLAFNLKTAKTIGIVVPRPLIALADEVIE